MSKKALRVINENPTDHGYVIREEYWSFEGFEAEVISDPVPENGEAQQLADAINDNQSASPSEMFMTTCYTNDGYWIGDLEIAKMLCENKGIRPTADYGQEVGELRPCRIGFNESEQKWYGWSHRVILGFGIGDIVSEGDCTASSGWAGEYLAEHPEEDKSLPVGFKAETLDDARKMAIAFAESVG